MLLKQNYVFWTGPKYAITKIPIQTTLPNYNNNNDNNNNNNDNINFFQFCLFAQCDISL